MAEIKLTYSLFLKDAVLDLLRVQTKWRTVPLFLLPSVQHFPQLKKFADKAEKVYRRHKVKNV
jgi:hypothetical protein